MQDGNARIRLFTILILINSGKYFSGQMYSSGNPTNIANPIKDASIRIDIKTVNGKLTLFETTLCKKSSWDELDSNIDLDTQGYLRAYNEKDIQLICCQADARSLWLVPPVVQASYMKSLRWSMDIIFTWQLTRDRPKGKEVVTYELIVQDEDLPTYLEVMEVLNGTANSFRIHNVYPRYFRLTGSGDVRFLEESVCFFFVVVLLPTLMTMNCYIQGYLSLVCDIVNNSCRNVYAGRSS